MIHRNQGQGPLLTAALLQGDFVQERQRGRLIECKLVSLFYYWLSGWM